jgi:hypothetical protein
LENKTTSAVNIGTKSSSDKFMGLLFFYALFYFHFQQTFISRNK